MSDRRETLERIPLLEEEARITKHDAVTGRVRIATRVEEFTETARAILDGERVDIERVAVDREVESIPPVRTEGDVTIVPVVEEVLVVEKRLVLKEELRIRRSRIQEEVEVPVTLKRERASIERIPAGKASPDDQ